MMNRFAKLLGAVCFMMMPLVSPGCDMATSTLKPMLIDQLIGLVTAVTSAFFTTQINALLQPTQ